MPTPAQPQPWTEVPASVRPMLATPHEGSGDGLLHNARWVFERKLDGMRALVLMTPGDPSLEVTIWTRNGREKTLQFPDLVKDFKRFGRSLRKTVLLDGEIIAVDVRGQPEGFQRLAGRIHLTGAHAIAAEMRRTPTAFVAFDVLRDGTYDLRPLSLVQRRARLEKIIGSHGSEFLRLAEQSAGGDGAHWLDMARDQNWEGLIAKDAESQYVSGRRSPAWRKLKLPCRQEFVVGGWTEPRGGRTHFGSLLVGYFEGDDGDRKLHFAGAVGSGFDRRTLEHLSTLLRERAAETSPFVRPPRPPERPHWIRPELVVDVRFTEWTEEQVLRHPVYIALREDVDPLHVRREPAPVRISGGAPPPATTRSSTRGRGRTATKRGSGKPRPDGREPDPEMHAVIDHLRALEEAKRDGTLTLPGGIRLEVTNLWKVFWPAAHLTKGDLLRYYATVASWLLPVLQDRPLIMKRFPNGITGKTFYQQRAPDEVPAGVRMEQVDEDGEPMPRLIGGSITTLLYTAQLAAISQDPWFSRVQSRHDAQEAALDLDPMPGVPFAQVRDVARFVGDELRSLGVPAFAKTSGSSGVHIYIPLPRQTSYETGQLFCQIVATLVATRHPGLATVERSVSRRGRKVYIDYLQNIEGKSLAAAFSARASEFAGVSTPLAWDELDGDVRPEDFTIRSAFSRFSHAGHLWDPVTAGPKADLRAALERLASRA